MKEALKADDARMKKALKAEKARIKKALKAALARIKEAFNADKARMKKALKATEAQKASKYASIDADTLANIHLTLGNLSEALDYSKLGVQYALRSIDDNQKVSALNTQGDVLHHRGLLPEAEDIFRQAEGIKKNRGEQASSFLYSLGHRYHDLLLSQGKYNYVREMVEQIIKSEGFSRIDDALNHLLLGQAYLHLFQASHRDIEHFAKAETYLTEAMTKLRGTEREVHLPRGLLALTNLHRVAGAFKQAQTKLDEALDIARRGSMGLHLADCYLECARLNLAQGEKDKACESLVKAKDVVEQKGYHRRDKDIENVEEQLRSL
jgi:tetratricopeptide (TPR) repeat protein